MAIEVRRDGPQGEAISAFTYVARADGSGTLPSTDYLNHLIRGAIHHGLPDSYVRQLRSVANGEMAQGRS